MRARSPIHHSSFIICHSPSRAFTLLELVLVLVVFCTVMAMAAPSLRGFWAGARVRDTAVHVLALTTFARDQAVSSARVHRLTIDPAARTYAVARRDGDATVAIASDLGRTFGLPDGQLLELRRDDGQELDAIDFYPDGRCDPATIRLTDATGHTTEIVCPSPTERFSIK